MTYLSNHLHHHSKHFEVRTSRKGDMIDGHWRGVGLTPH
jgi:hypothetical protein